MTQLTLNIEKPSVLQLIKKLVVELDGVSIAKTPRKTTTSSAITSQKKKCGLKQAMEYIHAGRVNTYNSAEELFEKLGI